jgi:aspartyl protease family protein
MCAPVALEPTPRRLVYTHVGRNHSPNTVRNFNWTRFPAYLAWITIAVALYFYFDGKLRPRAERVTLADGAREIVIARALDGHHYVEGEINGYPITFVVDTGASVVSINVEAARKAGLPEGRAATFGTAAGSAQGSIVARQRVTAGGVSVDDLSVAVIPGLSEYGLLGQNFLRHMDVIQSGEKLTLRARPSK